VNPHFLFNSLNSISALTAVDAGQAREMCIRLADFLRTSLRLGERSNIPFGEEMDLTRMYLEVEKVRFGGKLRVAVEVEPACNGVEVPPLLIQPLVENAVKHGVAMMADGGEIRIEARMEKDLMRVRIENPYDPESPSQGRNGIGLRNIRARLESRFGHAASMEIQAREAWYQVTVVVPSGAKS
jgi:LytS/YehU family sensor histidine kinase